MRLWCPNTLELGGAVKDPESKNEHNGLGHIGDSYENMAE